MFKQPRHRFSNKKQNAQSLVHRSNVEMSSITNVHEKCHTEAAIIIAVLAA